MEDEKQWREMFEQELKKRKKQKEQEQKQREAQRVAGEGCVRMGQLLNEIVNSAKYKSKILEKSRQQLVFESRKFRFSSPTTDRSFSQLSGMISDAHAQSRQISQTEGTIAIEISRLRRAILDLQSKLQLYAINEANICNIDAQVNKNKGAMIQKKKQILKQMFEHQSQQQQNIEKLKEQAKQYDQQCKQAMKSDNKPRKKKKILQQQYLPSVVKTETYTPQQLSKHQLKQILQIKWSLYCVCFNHTVPRKPFPISKEKIRILGKMELIQAFQAHLFKLGREFQDYVLSRYDKLVHQSKQLESQYRLRQQSLAEKMEELKELELYLRNQTRYGSFTEQTQEKSDDQRQKQINQKIVHTSCQFLIAFIGKLIRITACIRDRASCLEDQANLNCLWDVMEQWKSKNIAAKWKEIVKQKDHQGKTNLINFVSFLAKLEKSPEMQIKKQSVKEILSESSRTIIAIFQWLHEPHDHRCLTDISLKTSPFNQSYCIQSPQFYCRQNHLRLIEKLENAKMRCMGTRRHLAADAELNEQPINTQRKYRINLKKVDDSRSKTSRKVNHTANQITLDDMKTEVQHNSYLFSSLESERFQHEQKEKMHIRNTLDIVKKIGISNYGQAEVKASQTSLTLYNIMFQPNIKEQKHALMERREQYRAQIRKDQVRERLRNIRQGMIEQSLKISLISLQQHLKQYILHERYEEAKELLQSLLSEVKKSLGQISQHSTISCLSTIIYENYRQNDGYFSDDEEKPRNKHYFIKDDDQKQTISLLALQILAWPKISYRNYMHLNTFLEHIWPILRNHRQRVFIYTIKIFENCLLDAQSSYNKLKQLGLQENVFTTLTKCQTNRGVHEAILDLLKAYYTHQVRQQDTDVIRNPSAEYFLKLATSYISDPGMQERALGLMGRLTDSFSYLNQHITDEENIKIVLNLILNNNLRVSQYALQLVDNLIYWTERTAAQVCVKLGILDKLELLIDREEKLPLVDQHQKARISKVSCIVCNLMCSKDRQLRKIVKYHTIIDAAFRGIYPNSRLLGLGRIFIYLFHQSDQKKVFHIVDNLLISISKLDLKNPNNYIFHEVIVRLWEEAQEFWPEADNLIVTLEKYGLDWVLEN